MIVDNQTSPRPGTPLILPVGQTVDDFNTDAENPGPPIWDTNNVGTDSFGKWSWGQFIGALLLGLVTGGPAGAAVGAASYAVSQLKPGDLVSSDELNMISQWFSTQFTPYFNTLITEANNLLENNFSAASLPRLNALQNKLCILRDFYKNQNTDTMLSPAAIDMRTSMVMPFIDSLSTLLHDKAATLGAGPQPAQISLATADTFLPKHTGTIPCDNYVVGKAGNPRTEPVSQTPVTVTPVMPSPMPAACAQGPIARNPILWIGGAFVLGALLWPDKKKKSKE